MFFRTVSGISALFYLLGPLHARGAPGLLQIVPSPESYGPDGPWQTVRVLLSNSSQAVHLIPGRTYHSRILSKDICGNSSLPLPCGAGGLYDQDASRSSIKWNDTSGVVWTMDGGQSEAVGIDTGIFEDVSFDPGDRVGLVPVATWSIRVVNQVYLNLPDGSGSYPAEVGILALANTNLNLEKTDPADADDSDGLAQKYTYGLHIGSAAMGIPLSLWVGGYDRSRVIGPVSVHPYALNPGYINGTSDWSSGLDDAASFVIDLRDIGIGVDNGASPFNFSERQNILNRGNSSIGDSLPVVLDSLAPYLHLPQSTCDAIASYLPVTYQDRYKLYFWDTEDPDYQAIVTSPSYLSLTFRNSGLEEANLTIKVPFSLLNLTLQAPITVSPTQFFPCRPPLAGGAYTL
ncbi:MAG: hypothetical protein Q9201_005705 [Fulgogasparrea decipioides]